MARPPTEINLSYDLEKKNLHVEARHVTKNPRKHFIRQIVFIGTMWKQRNVSMFSRQAHRCSARMPLWKRSPGDVLRVEAVCNEVGRKEATFVIP